jgi:hypothetical protein
MCDLSQELPLFEEDCQIVVHAAGMAHVCSKTTKEEDFFFFLQLFIRLIAAYLIYFLLEKHTVVVKKWIKPKIC